MGFGTFIVAAVALWFFSVTALAVLTVYMIEKDKRK